MRHLISFFKNTISEELCFKNLVIVTTREKRIGEVNGIDKEFVSEEEFEKLKKENKKWQSVIFQI